MTTTTSIDRVDQSLLEGYPVSNAQLVAHVDVDRLQSATIQKLALTNPGTGTRLHASGVFERWTTLRQHDAAAIPGRESFSLTGAVTQDLAVLVKAGLAKRATGTLSMPFKVESGDLVSYRLFARVIADEVSIAIPAQKFAISRLRGVIPIQQELVLVPTGIELLPGPKTNELMRSRYFDVQPFLNAEDFVAADRVTIAGETLAPVAGNVRIARTLMAIDQLQAGYRAGMVSGQLLADYGDAPIIAFRGNITGARPDDSEQVPDANAALTFAPSTFALDGKIQIVRIGRDHLRQILDVLDPYREDVAINRARRALAMGFPRFVRMRIEDSLMDAKVELGGVASVVRIDEIRAIPLAPLLEQFFAAPTTTKGPP